ncbi:MAG: hypothetical protein AVDCRST_MAG61-471, partial [uncultured Friedmanniella sp.]
DRRHRHHPYRRRPAGPGVGPRRRPRAHRGDLARVPPRRLARWRHRPGAGRAVQGAQPQGPHALVDEGHYRRVRAAAGDQLGRRAARAVGGAVGLPPDPRGVGHPRRAVLAGPPQPDRQRRRARPRLGRARGEPSGHGADARHRPAQGRAGL